MFINFLLLPLTIFLLTLFFFGMSLFLGFFLLNEKFIMKKRVDVYFRQASWYLGKPLVIILLIVELSIALSLALAATVIMTVLVIGPAYIFQLFKLFKIIFLWCCKTNDKKEKKR